MISTFDPFARAIVGAFGMGMVAAAMLALGVWLVVRVARPSATTQHALWWIVLCAAVALPIARAATSFAHVEHRAAHRADRLAHRAADRISPSDAVRRAISSDSQRRNEANERRDEISAPTSASAAPAWIAIVTSAAQSTLTFPGLATLLVALWLAVAALRVGVLGAGLVGLMRMKRSAIELDASMVRRLRRFRHSLRSGRPVSILLTDEIDVPVAVGFGKPAILLPSLVAHREEIADLDQIVMHEHAHLNRYDDVTNFVQCVFEAIFWFNPVLLLVGERISLQREIACDDSVIAQTGRAHRYATCLWRLVESSSLPARRVVAPGALFTPKQITTRIEQLLDSKRNALPRLSPATALAFALIAAVVIVAVASRAPVIAIEDPLPAIAVAVPPATVAAAPLATPGAIADAVIDATMKRSLMLEQRDTARQVSERLAPTADVAAIERSLSAAKNRAQHELAFAEAGTTEGELHRSVAPFRRIRVDGSFDVEVRRGSRPAIDFQGDDFVASHTKTEVSDDTLSIDQSNGSYSDSRSRKTIVVYTPSLDGVEINGSADVSIPSASGAHLTIDISGSGDLVASGSVAATDVTIDGSGDVDLSRLQSTSMHIASEGSGDVKILAPTTLNVRLDGSGDVTMRGTPKHLSTDVNGSGSIIRI